MPRRAASLLLLLLAWRVPHTASGDTARARALAVQETPDTGNVSLPCDSALLSGGAPDAAFCNRLAYDAARNAFSHAPTLQPAGNIDPPLGSYFPADARIPRAAQAQAGALLAPQRGWGGGPNVSLGPQQGVVWGVHATPATAPGAASPGAAAVLLSWHLGVPTLNGSAPAGALVPTPSAVAFVPAGIACTADITFAPLAGAAPRTARLAPTCLRYRRVYTAADVAGHAYTSPLLCHAVLAGLAPGASYNYSLAATVVTANASTAAYGTPANLGAPLPFTFNTPPAAGAPAAAAYPQRFVVMSDAGQTYNSSLTAQYIRAYIDAARGGGGGGRVGVDLLLNMGDFGYADGYGPGDAQRTCEQTRSACGSAQARTDAWFTMWQPVLSRTAAVHAAGNHELETEGVAAMALSPADGPASYGVAGGSYPFQSFAARTPPGALPPGAWGDAWRALYFSQDVGPVHLVVLQNYIPFGPGSAQHAWFTADMAALDRRLTPWLVVAFHGPAYHSYVAHYKEMECFLSIYEPLFYRHRVDFVFNGHVHAYERTHPVYAYERDACGPVYITVGDGGNVEGPYRNYVDELVPGSNVTYCEAEWGAALRATPDSNAASGLPPDYQARVHPPGCPTVTYQRAAAGARGAVEHPRAPGRFFCQASQPAWSAFREPAFGFAGLTFLNDSAAQFTWFRNVDQVPGGTLRGADNVTYTRYAGACAGDAAPPPAASPPRRSGGGGAAMGVLDVMLVACGCGAAVAWWRRSRQAAPGAARVAPAEGAAGASEEEDEVGTSELRPLRREDLTSSSAA